jgi:hypothetical protein
MSMQKRYWDRIILDAAPPVTELAALAAGDLDGDGHVEVLVGGGGGLLWYRPDTYEKGLVAEGRFGVGLVLEDLDRDGLLEVVTGVLDEATSTWVISWYKPQTNTDLSQPWAAHVIDPKTNGSPHDIIFHDVDRDGARELIANAAYCEVPGVFVYKPGADPAQLWRKHTVNTGVFSEGLQAGDIDGDGRVEIVHGPDWYSPPLEGPFSGPWERRVYAPSFREMSRTALVDITGSGRDDIVIAESEYVDGALSWFENRLVEDPENPWTEHPMEEGLNFAHSLVAWRDADTDAVHFFVAEMASGGWNQPYNWNARLIEYTTADGGETWRRELIDKGAGTHQALVFDVDGDGALEVVGKEWGKARTLPRVQIWKQREEPSPLLRFRHRFIDRDKPGSAIDVLVADVDGDGLTDLICGAWWYRNPAWERRTIGDIRQVLCAYDIDGDGRAELIGSKATPENQRGLTNELFWLNPVDPLNDEWEEYPVGTCRGDWPHGTAIAPLLPGGKLALVTAYHSANSGEGHYPELWEIPDDPASGPWPKRVLAEIIYGEELIPYDLDGDGELDVVAGPYWVENLGDGTFEAHQLADVPRVARIRVADVNGNGHADILYVAENVDWRVHEAYFDLIGWLENPGDPRVAPWENHVIDKVRSPHSIDVADLDGDGEIEVIVGEHDPFKPYRSHSRLLVYKKAEPQGRAWVQYVLDGRFEHHDGSKVFELEPGRLGIVSHGWVDERYLHLWEPY